MSIPQISNRSIVFLTDDKNNAAPLVEAMVAEEFLVDLHSRTSHFTDQYLKNDMDMFIIESDRFSLEELSAYARLRTSYAGLLVLLVNELDEMLQVMLYEQGIDDLLVKPINPLLLLARIRVLFRRNVNPKIPSSLNFNNLEINCGSRKVSCNKKEIPLSSREFDLLWYLAKNAHITLDRDRLYNHVFGIKYNGYDRSLDMYISRIRTKLVNADCSPHFIKTVRGKGYLFAAID